MWRKTWGERKLGEGTHGAVIAVNLCSALCLRTVLAISLPLTGAECCSADAPPTPLQGAESLLAMQEHHSLSPQLLLAGAPG